MPKQQYQTDFLQSETVVLQSDEADLEYQPNFITHQEALDLYEKLVEETPWTQEVVQVYGKSHHAPRLSCWVSDPSMSYSYSYTKMKPTAWTPTLLQLKAKLESSTDCTFNSVLLNYYRDGQDTTGWHSDDEIELGRNPIIGSISLGAPRDFLLRHKHKPLKHKMALENGSLLMMRGSTQHFWQHHVPKRANTLGRINLTFRTIKVNDY